MAEEWIKMRKKLLKTEQVKAMALRLKVTRQHIGGCLLAAWGLADEHAVERPDPHFRRDICPTDGGTDSGTNDGSDESPLEGFLRYSTLADIDHEAEQRGFAAAMIEVGWLREYEDGIGFPQYEIHNSKSAKKRSSEQKRKAKQRSKKQPCPDQSPAKCPSDVPHPPGQTAGPEGEGEIEGELDKEPEGGGGGGGRSQDVLRPQGATGPSAGNAATAAGVEEFLEEWGGIGGVSQEHAVISDELTVIDPQTRKLIEARMRDEYFSQNWRRGLRYVRTSDLCCGRVPPREGYQAPWRANVKWFCSPGELQKILAGKYGGNADGRTEEEEEQDWARAGAEQEADQ